MWTTIYSVHIVIMNRDMFFFILGFIGQGKWQLQQLVSSHLTILSVEMGLLNKRRDVIQVWLHERVMYNFFVFSDANYVYKPVEVEVSPVKRRTWSLQYC